MVSTNITTSTIVAGEACTENDNLGTSHSSQPAPLQTIPRPQNDIGTLVRTILFEILGLLIGAATLFVAIIAIRVKKHQPDIESGPFEQHELPSLPDVYLGRDERLLESGLAPSTPSIRPGDIELPEWWFERLYDGKTDPNVCLLVGSLANKLYTGIAYYGSRVVELFAHLNPVYLAPVVRRKVVMCCITSRQHGTHTKKVWYSSTYLYSECIQQILSIGRFWWLDW
jgi:hypothetical protein